MGNIDFEIRAPSRLHFGLLSFGREAGPQYGGLGVMVQRPGLVLRASNAAEFLTDGPMSDRIRDFANSWQSRTNQRLPDVELKLTHAAPQHAGLGTGTQLGLAVAAALFRAARRPIPPAEELALVAGRAQRSSVGTHGFDLGGLIYERGKSAGQRIGLLKEHVELPTEWRVVLITPTSTVAEAGLSGEAERAAFGQLPSVPQPVTDRLVDLIESRIIPSAKDGDLPAFGEAVYEYGVTAGSCFVEAQGGPFATPALERWVEMLRGAGVAGIGQSSWGPTLFAFCENELDAERLVGWCQERSVGGSEPKIQVTPIAAKGACARVSE